MNKFIKFCYCVLLGIFTLFIVMLVIGAIYQTFTL